MRFLVTMCLAAVPALAAAEPRAGGLAPHVTEAASPVIGGAPAPAGKWPDTAAVYYGPDCLCSGTLIAPTVVLTAGHCVIPDGGPPVSSVKLGTTDFASAEGESIRVTKYIEYPSSQSTEDIGLLILEHAATEAPRAIASGWARVDIKNGAAVQFVGFGTVTKDASDNNSKLMEAQSTITDFDCTINKNNGCFAGGMPDGELGAGGGGIDTCPGDSGGPMYLLTSYGNFVAGVTSRGYFSDQFACSEGGIYERPDKVVDWIEMAAGVPVSRGPEPTADPIVGVRGDGVETVITPNDPLSTEHSYEITMPPAHARAAVRGDGTVRACLDNAVGMDKLVVTITDKKNTERKLAMTIPITIQDGDPGSDCDPTAFGGDSGGCCDSGRNANGSLLLAGVVLLVLRRRR